MYFKYFIARISFKFIFFNFQNMKFAPLCGVGIHSTQARYNIWPIGQKPNVLAAQKDLIKWRHTWRAFFRLLLWLVLRHSGSLSLSLWCSASHPPGSLHQNWVSCAGGYSPPGTGKLAFLACLMYGVCIQFSFLFHLRLQF